MFAGKRLSTDLYEGTRSRLQHVLAFWAALAIPKCNEGGTRDGVLEGLRAEVEDVLSRGEPIDFNLVESLTAQAAFLLQRKRPS